ncbi:MAG: tetratricopeptide repeat protein [Verrucomicrobia bacterium]|nr:tetratricopeptide repeat protein [Verrucomicrobiota bacterium]
MQRLPRWIQSPLARAILLVAAVVAAYAGSLGGGFLWDDDLHITANPTIVGPLGLKEIWTTSRANYFPLVLTNFWLQHAAWGLEPFGYRVVTLLFHAGAAVLLWRVLLRLRVPGAWLGAALWALHPVQVESVAWICELKNTQSAVFFLAAALWYARWLEARGSTAVAQPAAGRSGPYLAALGFGVLALLSKPSTVMLPVALALIAWWQLRRVVWRDLLPLVPFFALSAMAAGWTIWEQKYHSGAAGEAWNQTLPERCVIAGRAIWFYLGKLAWPEPLIFIYPRWEISARSVAAFLPLVAALGTLVALGWAHRRRAAAAAFFAGAYFVVLLFPVLGFFSVYFFRYSFVGDHFQYLASMGPLALAAAALGLACQRGDPALHEPATTPPARATRPSRPPEVGSMLSGLLPWIGGPILVGLAVLTAREAREYLSHESLWRATLARNPEATMAWLNLGDAYVKQGRLDEAIATFTHVTRIRPTEVDAYNDLGGALLLAGRPAEARPMLERAVALAPHRAEMHNNLGNALRGLGRKDDAVRSFRRALELDSEYAEAHGNLGAELAELGRAAEGMVHFEAALRLAPASASANNNLGIALRVQGRYEEAVVRHREALRLKPDFAEARSDLGYTLALAGRIDEGVALVRQAAGQRPGHAGIRGNAGRVLALAGRTGEAREHFVKAVELAPESAEARNNLGTVLAQLGEGAAARDEFARAVALAPDFALARANLGNALFASQRWLEAAEQFETALRLRPGDADWLVRLAVARVNGGRVTQAVEPFAEALRLRPEAAEWHEQFAQVLRAVGRAREALEHFERAAELRRVRR